MALAGLQVRAASFVRTAQMSGDLLAVLATVCRLSVPSLRAVAYASPLGSEARRRHPECASLPAKSSEEADAIRASKHRTDGLECLVRVIVAVSSAGLALVLNAACSNGATLTWTEDVRLPDGRIITLERYSEFKAGAGQPGSRSTESLQRFKFKHPTTGVVVRWENVSAQGTLKTIALLFDGDKPLLLTRPAYGNDLITFRCPNPPYLLYEYVHGQWLSKPLAQIGVERLRANMTTHSLDEREQIERNKNHLSVEQTTNSYTYRDGKVRTPHILEFKGAPEQTFRVYENCDRPLNYLLAQ